MSYNNGEEGSELDTERGADDSTQNLIELSERLRQSREQSGLSLNALYEKTKIPLKKLESLESGKAQDTDAPVFVRGYIRSYAKIVNADANALVSLFDAAIDAHAKQSSTHTEPDVFDKKAAKPSKPTLIMDGGTGRKSYAPVIGALVLALGILVLVWVVYLRVVDTNDADKAGTSEFLNAKVMQLPEQSNTPEIASDSDVISSDDAPLAESVPNTDQTVVAEAGPAVTVLAESDGNNQNQSDTSATLPDDTASSAQTPLSQIGLERENTSQRSLEFSFSDLCWLEVRDADDKVVFADLQNSGDNLRLFGTAPFNIMLGNARAATLLLDGEPVEINVAEGRQTARIRALGALR